MLEPLPKHRGDLCWLRAAIEVRTVQAARARVACHHAEVSGALARHREGAQPDEVAVLRGLSAAPTILCGY